MKVKVNPRSRKTHPTKNLHSTVQQSISKPSSASSIKAIAGKLRSLSVVLSDITKNTDLLTHQGWENVGNGVWKLKENDFQHATRFKGRGKPTGASFQEKSGIVAPRESKLKRTSSIESVSVMTNLRSKRFVGNGKKTLSSCDSSSEAEVVKICVYGAGVAPKESNMKNKGVEKSIKVNLLRQKIGPKGEMGWRIRRRDSLQRDSLSQDGARKMRKLSLDLSESNSMRPKRGGKIENGVNSEETIISVSLCDDQSMKSSNDVVLEPLKRKRSGGDIKITQDMSVPSLRKTRGESKKNSTKTQGHVGRLNNEKGRFVSNGRELVSLRSTRSKRNDGSTEFQKDLLNLDSPRPSKVRAVETLRDLKSLVSTRIKRVNKKENESKVAPTMISKQSKGNKSDRSVPELDELTSDERRPQDKEFQNQAESTESKSKIATRGSRLSDRKRKSVANFLVRKARVVMKKTQALTKSGSVNSISGKKQKSAVKKKGANINNRHRPTINSGNANQKEVRMPRKRSNKVQLEWCSYCGLQLDSVENRLEHEFSHEEPRQLQVSLHLCSLNSSSVKLPVYVDSDEVAAFKSPQEEDDSTDLNENRPLLDVNDVLNEYEYEAYDDVSDCVNEDEDHNQEGNIHNNDNIESTVSDSIQSEENEIKMTFPRKAKEKAHVKMRLWVKSQPRITRSSRSEKQLVQKNNDIEECESLMTADFVSDDVLPPEDGLHDYVEVVVDKGSPGRIMVDDETIKDVDVSTTDQGDSEASKMSAELSPINKDIEESFKEETASGSKELEEAPEIAASLGLENSDINSNEIVIGDHNFMVQESEKPGCSENFGICIMEKTGDTLELNAVEAENEIIGNLDPKMGDISNEIDEDNIRNSDPKLSEINNDALEDEMEEIESDLCKVDCGNIEDDMENLNANFREMNDGIVGEIIGLDPNENELNHGTVRSKIEGLGHNSSEDDHEKIVDEIENSNFKLTEKGADLQENTQNKILTEVHESSVESELESTQNKILTEVHESSVESELERLDQKLTEINKQQDEEEHKSRYSNLAATTPKKIKSKAANKEDSYMEVDDVADCMASIVPELPEFVNEAEDEVKTLDSSLAEVKSSTSSCSPEKVSSRPENLNLASTEISDVKKESVIDDSQSNEINDISTNLNKVKEHELGNKVEKSDDKPVDTGEVEDSEGEPKDSDSDFKVDGVEGDLAENKANTNSFQNNEINDFSTVLDEASEDSLGNEVEESDSEPKGADFKMDGVEDDLEDNHATGLENKGSTECSHGNETNNFCTVMDEANEHNLGNEVDDSEGEPKETDYKVDSVENDLAESHVASLENKANIDSSQSNEINDCNTVLDEISEDNLGNEVEDCDGEPKETDMKVDGVEPDLAESHVASLGNKGSTDNSQSNEINNFCTVLDEASEDNKGNAVEESDSEPKEADFKMDGVEDDSAGSHVTSLENKANTDSSQNNEINEFNAVLDEVSEDNLGNKVKDCDGEPKETDMKVDGVEHDLAESHVASLGNTGSTDNSQSDEINNFCTVLDETSEDNKGNAVEESDSVEESEPKEADFKMDGEEDDSAGSHVTSFENKANTDSSQNNEINEFNTVLDEVSEDNLGNEVEDSVVEPEETDFNLDGREDDLKDISDEDVKPKKANDKVVTYVDGLEDISDGEFEPVDDQSVADISEDGVDCGEGLEVEKVVESMEELITEKKVERRVRVKVEDNRSEGLEAEKVVESKGESLAKVKVERTVRVKVEDKSEVVVKDNIKSSGETPASDIKVEDYDDDEDDKDTVILDHGYSECNFEGEEFIVLSECDKDDNVDEEPKDSNQNEGEIENNVETDIESTDVFNLSRVLSNRGTNLVVKSTENEGNENPTTAVSSCNVETPTIAKDYSFAVINGDSKTLIFEEKTPVMS